MADRSLVLTPRPKEGPFGSRLRPMNGPMTATMVVRRALQEGTMSVQELHEMAHDAASQLEAHELAGQLQDVLGQKLVAFAVGDRHPKTIGRYARRERDPDDETLAKLVNLYTLVQLLERGMRRQAVRSWMLGSNPRLRAKAPIEAFHEGRLADVERAARAFLTNR